MIKYYFKIRNIISISMNTLIKTDKSSLLHGVYENFNLIDECVGEISDKLIKNPPIVVYGKVCYQRRSVGFFSDVSEGYYFSGQLSKSIPLTDSLKKLLDDINEKFKSDFNGILINEYDDGNEYIGKHSDNEKSLGNVGVLCISYGAVRNFRIRNKSDGKIVMDIPTKPYEILIMGGEFQSEFTHEIPIQKRVKGKRFSFTFRKHLR